MRSIDTGREIIGIYSNMAKKGRNQDLIDARDAKLLERFIYWTEDQQLRSDSAVKILANSEFFLSEYTVMQVLNKAYSKFYGKKVQVVFHQPKPPKLTKEQKEMLKRDNNG